jgi:Zn-dependent protease with chaperone function
MVAGYRTIAPPPLTSARQLERVLWRRLWLPLLPAGVICGALVGWAIAEQRPADERLTSLAMLAASPFALFWARALARAAWWLWRRDAEPLAATVGLLQPAVVVSDVVRNSLDAHALVAVHAHERAHALHRDPLRIWLAQLATDLQWPCVAARLRFQAWRRALEMARDEEVRAAGTDGLDLAAAILGVARLACRAPRTSAAFLDDESSFRERIERLMAPPAVDPGPTSCLSSRLFLLTGLAGAIVAGEAFGDPIVAALLRALA